MLHRAGQVYIPRTTLLRPHFGHVSFESRPEASVVVVSAVHPRLHIAMWRYVLRSRLRSDGKRSMEIKFWIHVALGPPDVTLQMSQWPRLTRDAYDIVVAPTVTFGHDNAFWSTSPVPGQKTSPLSIAESL